MKVGVARLALKIPNSQSLKAKRKVLRSILDKTRSRFKVSIAEVDKQDKWQLSIIGFAYVSAEGKHADEVVQKVIHFIEGLNVAYIIEYNTEILHMGNTWENEAFVEKDYSDIIDESFFSEKEDS